MLMHLPTSQKSCLHLLATPIFSHLNGLETNIKSFTIAKSYIIPKIATKNLNLVVFGQVRNGRSWYFFQRHESMTSLSLNPSIKAPKPTCRCRRPRQSTWLCLDSKNCNGSQTDHWWQHLVFLSEQKSKIHWLSRNQSHVEYPKNHVYTPIITYCGSQRTSVWPLFSHKRPKQTTRFTAQSFHPPRYTFDIRLTRMMKLAPPASAYFFISSQLSRIIYDHWSCLSWFLKPNTPTTKNHTTSI